MSHISWRWRNPNPPQRRQPARKSCYPTERTSCSSLSNTFSSSVARLAFEVSLINTYRRCTRIHSRRSSINKSVGHRLSIRTNPISFVRQGFLLFKEFCSTLCDEPVPQLKFYEEVKKRLRWVKQPVCSLLFRSNASKSSKPMKNVGEWAKRSTINSS